MAVKLDDEKNVEAKQPVKKATPKKAAPKAKKATKSASVAATRKAREDRQDLMLARAALADIERNGTVPWSEVKSRLGR